MSLLERLRRNFYRKEQEAAITIVAVAMTCGMLLLMYFLAIGATLWSIGTFVVIDVAGVVLIGSVALDMLRRVEAKRQLASKLSLFTNERYLWTLLYSPVFPPLRFEYPPQPLGLELPPPEQWMELWEFLRLDPFGRIASQALYQRSLQGRDRYLTQVMRMADRIRRRR